MGTMPGGTEAEHSIHNPKIKGLNPATGTDKEIMAKRKTPSQVAYSQHSNFFMPFVSYEEN
jgi:hypothetical protein